MPLEEEELLSGAVTRGAGGFCSPKKVLKTKAVVVGWLLLK